MVLGRRESPVLVGHRGGLGPDWPAENTMAAFERARVEGAHAVETDVRLCASGEPVLFHDPYLTRMTDERDRRCVDDLSLGELRRVELRGEGAHVPTLRELVAWAREHGLGLNVEIKHDVPARRRLVRAVAAELRGARVPLLISSFDPAMLVMTALLAPGVPRALLTDKTQRYAGALHAIASPRLLFAVHVERSQANTRAVSRWKARGLAVGAWTVNEPSEALALARAGVDILITDRMLEIAAVFA